MKKIQKLLVIRLSALGDICMTLPVIDSFCRAYPHVQVTFLTSKLGAVIAETVISQPNFAIRICNKNDYRGISGVNRLYSELKPLNFDAVADLHDVLRTKWSALRFRLSGTPVKVINKGRKDKKDLVAHKINYQLKSGFERYLDVFKELGLPFALDYDGKQIGASLSAPAIKVNSESLGIAPFAQHQGKIYPVGQMTLLIDELLKRRRDLTIYLFGSKDESPVLEQWRAKYPDNIVNIAGIQSIAEDLRVMARLKAMISMDSANMHLASLVGLRCFSIWGATHRHAGFLGYGQKETDCLEVSAPCRPCSIYGNKPCQYGDYHCMTQIKPEEAAEKILNL